MKIDLAKAAAFGLLGAAFVAAPARAATVHTFFGEDFVNGNKGAARPQSQGASTNFQASLSGVSTEDFENFTTGTKSPFTLMFGTDSATITSTPAADTFIENTAGGAGISLFPTSGDKFVETTTDMTLTFNKPQAAFGFWGTDIGDSGATSLILTLGNATHDKISVPAKFGIGGTGGSNANGSVLFFGMIADPGKEFTSVTFADNSGGGDHFLRRHDHRRAGQRGEPAAAPAPDRRPAPGRRRPGPDAARRPRRLQPPADQGRLLTRSPVHPIG